MVTTRAQGVSASRTAERLPQVEQSEANVHAPQPDRLDVLAHQVQVLVEVVKGMQGYCLAAAPPPPPLHEEGPGTARSHQGGTPPEVSRHSPLEPRHRESSKRRRSLTRHSSRSHRGSPEKEPRRAQPSRRPSPKSSPKSSSDSSEKDVHRRTTRRTEQRLDEYNQRLEELSRRISNPHAEDYDHRPPLSRRIMEEPVPPRFRLPQLDPYDGTTDPLDHLESYKVLMQVQGSEEWYFKTFFDAGGIWIGAFNVFLEAHE